MGHRTQKKGFCAGTKKFCSAKVPSSAQAKRLHLPAAGETFLRFCLLNMSEKQSHNRVYFRKHFNVASNTNDLMNQCIVIEFSFGTF